jgi:hypothetical protein
MLFDEPLSLVFFITAYLAFNMLDYSLSGERNPLLQSVSKSVAA